MTPRSVPAAVVLAAAFVACDTPAPATPPAAVVEEEFMTEPAPTSNMDSPAVWMRAAGPPWLIGTGKSTNRLYVYDAATGAAIRTVGGAGTAAGAFRRPNGIAVTSDLLLVVERDNARVQVLHLPAFEPIAIFGEGILRRPYGIAVL
ncbi:MAG: phytase, partial [Longimicrobiales bacterium]